MTRFNKYISIVLLLALSCYVMPKELVHEFFHHDTIDAIISHSGETTVGNAHEHCDLLELTSPPFQKPINAFSFCASSCCFTYLLQEEVFYSKELTANQYLRGPPVA